MWSLKITTEQRYKYFEPILPDIKADMKLFWNLFFTKGSELPVFMFKTTSIEHLLPLYKWMKKVFTSFMIERTLDNNYQITFYE